MKSSNESGENADNGKSEASLFEAISHGTRIRTLFLLRDHPLGFSELKHELGIKSSGNLQHHLGKMEALVSLNGEGLYALTEQGKESIMAIQAVRRTQNRGKSDRVIIALVYAFSMYIGFMNSPFLFGTVNALTPLLSLWMAIFMGIFVYFAWPWIYRHAKRNQE
jgi:DNA-binding HxlR family transcriptional regulator